MRMYSTTASINIPLEVDYTCCYCQKETVDTDQTLYIAGSSHGSMSPSPGLAEEARNRAGRSLTSALESLREGNYRPAYLNCKCPACGKKQPWALFKKQNGLTSTLLVLAIVFLISFIVTADSMSVPRLPATVFLVVMVAPWLVIEIYNFVIGQKVSKLDDQYRPRIILKSPEAKRPDFGV